MLAHPRYKRTGSPCSRQSYDSALPNGYRDAVDFLLQISGKPVPSNSKPKSAPKDFVRENVKKMRQIQARCKEQQHELERNKKPVKALWKNQKYDGVSSKLSSYIHSSSLSHISDSSSAIRTQSLPSSPISARRSSGLISQMQSPNHDSVSSSVNIDNKTVAISRSTSLPRIRVPSAGVSINETSAMNHAGLNVNKNNAKNFIAANAAAVKDHKSKKPNEIAAVQSGASSQKIGNRTIGKVPKYLQTRKQQWKEEEEKRKKEMPDPSIPPGHIKISDEEKKNTLEQLNKSYEELMKQLNRLPITCDSLRSQKYREDIEKQLHTIEEGIRIFSRSKVFVRNE
ncbi:ENKD1 (predicted) [Pycnogonum litorale]